MTATRFRLILAALPVAILAGNSSSTAGDRTADARLTPVVFQKTKTKAKKSDSKTGEKKPRKFRGRLPAYYGKAGVTNTQRQKIYQIQKSYREKILALEKQLRELRDKQSAEVEAVLTPAQKKKVDELRAAAKKKRGTKKKAATKEGT